MKYQENKKLDYIIKLAFLDCGQKDVEEFDSIDDSEVVISKKLDKKVKKLIDKSYNSCREVKVKRSIIRLMVAALIIMSLILGTLFAVSATRNAIFEAIMNWYDDYFTIRFEMPVKVPAESNDNVTDAPTEENPAEENSTDNNESTGGEKPTEKPIVHIPTKIEEVIKPSYFPEGTEEVISQFGTMVNIEYYKDGEFLFLFNQLLLDEQDQYLNNVNASITNVDIDGNVGYLIKYDYATNIVWNNGRYVFVLETEMVSDEDLLKIARSVAYLKPNALDNIPIRTITPYMIANELNFYTDIDNAEYDINIFCTALTNRDGVMSLKMNEHDTALHDISSVEYTDIVAISVSGKDPYITWDLHGIIANDFKCLHIRMSVPDDGEMGQMYFVTDTEPEYSDDKSYPIIIQKHKNMHSYYMELSNNPHWKGNITQIRIDPVSYGIDSDFNTDISRVCKIDKMELLRDFPNAMYCFNLYHGIHGEML